MDVTLDRQDAVDAAPLSGACLQIEMQRSVVGLRRLEPLISVRLVVVQAEDAQVVSPRVVWQLEHHWVVGVRVFAAIVDDDVFVVVPHQTLCNQDAVVYNIVLPVINAFSPGCEIDAI